MKRRNIILAILPIIMAIFALQSCTKKEEGTFKSYGAFTTPTVVAPANAALISLTGTTYDLKWATTDADTDAQLSSVYFGTTANPPLFKAVHTGLTLSVPVAESMTYYWRVQMKDANGVTTDGPVWSFSTKFNYNADNFVGLFDCNEPGYAHYNCNLTKINATTIKNDNFWDSGWTANYVFDSSVYPPTITLTPVSYVAGGATYSITGSGKQTGTTSFYVDYVVKKNGVNNDVNTHTFTKK